MPINVLISKGEKKLALVVPEVGQKFSFKTAMEQYAASTAATRFWSPSWFFHWLGIRFSIFLATKITFSQKISSFHSRVLDEDDDDANEKNMETFQEEFV